MPFESPPILFGVADFGQLVSQHGKSRSEGMFCLLSPLSPANRKRRAGIIRKFRNLQSVLVCLVRLRYVYPP
jgi:hypothetical protein